MKKVGAVVAGVVAGITAFWLYRVKRRKKQ